MQRLVFLLACSSCVAGVVLGVASCAGSSAPAKARPAQTDPDGDNGEQADGSPADDARVMKDGSNDGDRSDALPPSPGEIYAHTAKTLYKLEPISKALTRVGDFSCTASGDASGEDVIDIALDKDGKMYGTTFNSLLSINPATAACTVVATQGAVSFPNALSFVPAGTADPAVEALVGFAVDDYVKIDTATGEMTTIGNLNPNALGIAFESSGDIVSVNGDKTYLTARELDSDAGGGDYLLEIDPSTGKVVKQIVDTNKKLLFGLGYWAGTAYAFSANGDSYAIDLSNGFTTALSFPNGPTPDAGGWFGAGSTTLAPTR